MILEKNISLLKGYLQYPILHHYESKFYKHNFFEFQWEKHDACWESASCILWKKLRNFSKHSRIKKNEKIMIMIWVIDHVHWCYTYYLALEDPLWSSGHDTRLLNGKAVVWIRGSANAFELVDLKSILSMYSITFNH